MRDSARLEQLITHLAGLEHVQFNLNADVSYLDMSTYAHQDASDPPEATALSKVNLPFHTGINSAMTSSITSSLASPVDSGVALLDSDADATSVSETTLNGGDNLSLREDDSTFAELDDVKLTQQTLEQPVFDNIVVEASVNAGLVVYDDSSITQDASLVTRELTIQKPVLIEAVLLNTQDGRIENTQRAAIKSAHDIEKALIQDAGSHFFRKAMFHNGSKPAHSSSEEISEDETPKITITNAQLPGVISNSKPVVEGSFPFLPFCETEAALEVYEVCPLMTASDIANQNVEPLNIMSNARSSNFVPSSGLEKNVFKNNAPGDKSQSAQELQESTCTNKPSTDCDEIVFRRQRKKRNKSEVKVKRVSFHDDIVVNTIGDINLGNTSSEGSCDLVKKNENFSDFSASFLPPNPIIKKDVVRGRYSWCAEGDAPYVTQRYNYPDTRSDVFLTSNSESTTTKTRITLPISKDCIPTAPQSSLDFQLLNQDPNLIDGKPGNITTGLTNLGYKYQSSTENLGYEEPRTKIFHDRFSYRDQALFDDGDGMMLQMDSLIQSSQQPDSRKVGLNLKHLPVTERGTPEGQEDPQRFCSTQHLYPSAAQSYSFPLKKFPSAASSIDCISELESLRSGLDDRYKNNLTYGSYNKTSQAERFNLRRHSNVRECRTSLLNRFLKSVTVKKYVEKKARVVKQMRSMYIKGVKFDYESNRKFNSELNSEIKLGQLETPPKCEKNVPVNSSLEMIFKSQIFENENEHIYKVFRVRSCYFVNEASTALLVLLTNVNLYVTGTKMNHTYCNHLVLPYPNLESVLVGPNSQTIMLVSTDGSNRFTIATGDKELTNQLVGRIELAMRTNRLDPPAVRFLELEDMKALAHSIRKSAGLVEDDLLLHYSLIHLQDDQFSPSCTPLGPTKEGHLMFRPATHSPLQSWAPAYCVLKAGVLYMFGEADHRLPKRVLMLRNGHCKGCLRMKDRRPHTFEILLKASSARSLQFAAADEYQASDWLQAFIQAASGVHESEGVETRPCSLLVTSRHIVTCHEQFPSGKAQALAVANIADITAFREEHSWCVLEFACREVHESSGDWALYFSSIIEMEKFRDCLQQLWQDVLETEFPLSSEWDENLRIRCMETGHVLTQVWEHLVPCNTGTTK